MKEALIDWITHTLEVLSYSNRRIIWNSFLAFIPLFCSIWLFRFSRSRSWLWWLIFAIFVAFLPNAPYVLTDIIHPIDFIRRGYSVWTVTLAIIPQYFIFILAGFEAYVLSLLNFGRYLRRQGGKRYILVMELTAHALCAVGIYLGRFRRFNSWDFITQPEQLAKGVVHDLASKFPILVMVVTFIVLVICYWLAKQLTIAVWLKIRYQKMLNRHNLHQQ